MPCSQATTARAYLDESAYARPHAVVGQLSPAPRVRDIALVEDAAEEVYQDGDDPDDREDGTRPDSLLCGLGGYAGGFREDLEMVGTLFGIGAYEGRGGLGGQRVFVAVEGDYCRFASGFGFCLFRFSGFYVGA